MTQFISKRRTLFTFAGLALFAAAPLAGSVARAVWFQTPPAQPDAFDAAVLINPSVLVAHMASACLFTLLGAAQIAPGLAGNRSHLHRPLGYLAWLSGMVMALTGVILVVAYPPSQGAGFWPHLVRSAVAALMLWLLVDGLCAGIGRNLTRHRNQMFRAWVLAAASTTNGVLIGLWMALTGDVSQYAFAGIMAIGWALALGTAEWRIRHRRRARFSGVALTLS